MNTTIALRSAALAVIALLSGVSAPSAEQNVKGMTGPACASHELAQPYSPNERAKDTGEFVVRRDRLSKPLEVDVWTMNEALAMRAISEGANPNSVSSGNKEPLIVVAAMQGNPRVIAALLSGGARIESFGRTGTPLYWAARQGNLEAVRLLLACGANVDFHSNGGGTAFHMTMGDGNDIRVAEALIDAGADLEARHSGMTPLMQAALLGRVAWVNLLIRRGANVNAVAADGTTVLGFARARATDPKIISSLIAAGAR